MGETLLERGPPPPGATSGRVPFSKRWVTPDLSQTSEEIERQRAVMRGETIGSRPLMGSSWIRAKMQDGLISAGMGRYQAGRLARDIVGTEQEIGLADIAPVSWALLAGERAGAAYARGEYVEGAFHSLAAAMGPFGRELVGAFQKGARKLAPGLFAAERGAAETLAEQFSAGLRAEAQSLGISEEAALAAARRSPSGVWWTPPRTAAQPGSRGLAVVPPVPPRTLAEGARTLKDDAAAIASRRTVAEGGGEAATRMEEMRERSQQALLMQKMAFENDAKAMRQGDARLGTMSDDDFMEINAIRADARIPALTRPVVQPEPAPPSIAAQPAAPSIAAQPAPPATAAEPAPLPVKWADETTATGDARNWIADRRNEVVEVDIERLMENTAADQRIGLAAQTRADDVNVIGDRVTRARAHFGRGDAMNPSIVGVQDGQVVFMDGRHRLVAAHQMGERTAPVVVPRGEAEALRAIAGAQPAPVVQPELPERPVTAEPAPEPTPETRVSPRVTPEPPAPSIAAQPADLKADVKAFADELEQELNLKTLILTVDTRAAEPVVELNSLIVSKASQKAGAGTRAMEKVVSFADERGIKLTLSPGLKDPIHGTTSRARLVKFYKRFGFVENKGRNKDFSLSASMFREPIKGDLPAPPAITPEPAPPAPDAPPTRSHADLEAKLPLETRVASGNPVPGKQVTVSGGRFLDEDLEATGAGANFGQPDLDRMWQESVAETSGGAAEVAKLPNMGPRELEFWDRALRGSNRKRYWYEISAEGIREEMIFLSDEELGMLFDFTGATSMQADPNQNIRRALGALSQHLRGEPIDIDLISPGALRDALQTGELAGAKTGSYTGSFKFHLGLEDKPSLSTNDRQVAASFNIAGEDLANNWPLYEVLSRFYMKMRDTLNRDIGSNSNPHESQQIQALGWAEQRPGTSEDDLLQALGRVKKDLVDGGLLGAGQPLTRDVFLSPEFATLMSKKLEGFRESHIATVETLSKKTPSGKERARILQAAQDAGDDVAIRAHSDIARSSLHELMNTYRAPVMGADGKQAMNPDGTPETKKMPSVVSQIVSAVLGRPVIITRAEIGEGSFNGVLSVNARLPFPPDMTKVQREAVLAILGQALKQEAMAASHFSPAVEGEPVAPGYDTRTYKVFIPDISMPQTARKAITDALGHDVNVNPVPNGYVVEINPNFTNAGPVGPAPQAIDAALQNAGINPHATEVYPSDYTSDYLPDSVYATRAGAGRRNFIDDRAKELAKRISTKAKPVTQREARGYLEGVDVSALSGGKRRAVEAAHRRVRAYDDGTLRGGKTATERVTKALIAKEKVWNKRYGKRYPKQPPSGAEGMRPEVMERDPTGRPIKRRPLSETELSPEAIIAKTAATLEPGPVYRSRLSTAVDKLPEKMTKQQALKALGQNVSKEERDWVLGDLLEGEGAVTKAEVQAAFEANKIEITDIVKGGPTVTIQQSPDDGMFYIEKAPGPTISQTAQVVDIERDPDAGEGVWNVTFADGWNVNVVGDSHAEREVNAFRDRAAGHGVGPEGVSAMEGSGPHRPDLLGPYENRLDALAAIDKFYGGGEGQPAPFSQYQMPGSEEGSYRVTVMQLVRKPFRQATRRERDAGYAIGVTSRLDDPHGEATALVFPVDERGMVTIAEEDFHGGHFDPNTLVHHRTNERTLPDGTEYDFGEEFQSNWLQKGKHEGFRTPRPPPDDPGHRYEVFDARTGNRISTHATDTEASRAASNTFIPGVIADWDDILAIQTLGVPDAPFKTTWPQLALMHAMRKAAEKGKGGFGWTKAATQINRYGASERIDALEYYWVAKNLVHLKGVKAGRGTIIEKTMLEDKLAGYLGKDVADKIVKGEGKKIEYGHPDAPEESLRLEDLDIELGGKLYRDIYDKRLVQAANKFARKYGEQVAEVRMVREIGAGVTKKELWEAGMDEHPFRMHLALGEDALHYSHPFLSPVRVENMVTGKSTRFKTRDEGQAFIAVELAKMFPGEKIWFLKFNLKMIQDLLKGGVALGVGGLMVAGED